MAGKYDDIIHLPRHVSTHRLPMPMEDRAAQFAPFAALTGYDAVIRETGRLTHACTELTEGAKEELDRKLRVIVDELHTQPEITVTWFSPDERKDGGAYVHTQGRVKKLEAHMGRLVLCGEIIIPIDRIRYLELL